MLSILDALPTVYPQITDPSSNLAGLGAVPYPGKVTPYYAYDGTPIGYSNGCDPITDEPYLSGLDAVNLVSWAEENRIDWLQQWALPAMIVPAIITTGGGPLKALFWGFLAYMAPLPVAAFYLAEATLGETLRMGEQ